MGSIIALLVKVTRNAQTQIPVYQITKLSSKGLAKLENENI